MRRMLWVLVATALLPFLSHRTASAQSKITPITTKMTGVSGDLAKTETSQPVQKKQEEIVHDLDVLIAELEKQCQACRNGIKRNNPSQPMADSTIRNGTGGMGALVSPGESNKDWAKLSSRERDRILQSMSEGFPPEYRTVLERYYRRLAEEKSASSSADRAQPKTTETPADKP
jgi:hypothetical protein